jgi:hypothetical protein
MEHWRRIRTNNPLERILRELAAARLHHIAGAASLTKRYLKYRDANRCFSVGISVIAPASGRRRAARLLPRFRKDDDRQGFSRVTRSTRQL